MDRQWPRSLFWRTPRHGRAFFSTLRNFKLFEHVPTHERLHSFQFSLWRCYSTRFRLDRRAVLLLLLLLWLLLSPLQVDASGRGNTHAGADFESMDVDTCSTTSSVNSASHSPRSTGVIGDDAIRERVQVMSASTSPVEFESLYLCLCVQIIHRSHPHVSDLYIFVSHIQFLRVGYVLQPCRD